MSNINNQIFYPFYVFPGQQQIIYSNSQINNPNFMIKIPTIFYNPQTFFLNHVNYIQRQQQNETKLNEINNLQEIQVKTPDINKKKPINKKKINIKKQSIDQAQRLRRKLANRPKTYKTQKKMYLEANLSQLGIDDSKRVLRKKKRHIKKNRTQQQQINKKSQKQAIQKQIYQDPKSQSKQNNKLEKIQILKTQLISDFKTSLQFYNPQAQIPSKLNTITTQQIQQKKISLNSRKIEQVFN